MLDEIQEGQVIITAHGASQEVFDKVKAKGLEVIDASCLDVIKTHDLIKEKLENDYEILYIGKKGHPEAEGERAGEDRRGGAHLRHAGPEPDSPRGCGAPKPPGLPRLRAQHPRPLLGGNQRRTPSFGLQLQAGLRQAAQPAKKHRGE